MFATMKFLGLFSFFALAMSEVCERGALLEATHCTVAGDPHFMMFNKVPHDMQGSDQYYYVKKCCDVDSDDMPFAIMGKHFQVFGVEALVSTLDYITLELTDSNDDVYYAHIAYSFQCFYNADDADSEETKSLYDDNAGVCSDLNVGWGQFTQIGSRFKLYMYQNPAGALGFILAIDDTNLVTMGLVPFLREDLIDDVRLRAHTFIVLPMEEYKCFTCGLCGNFKNSDATFETCDGETVDVVAGIQPDNAFAYDITGNTYSTQYCDADATCAQERGKKYTCNKGDREIPEPCAEEVWELARAMCRQHVEDVWDCCTTDDEGCGLAIRQCAMDTCAEAQSADEYQLGSLAIESLNQDVSLLCETVEDNMLALMVEGQYNVLAQMVEGGFAQEVTPVVDYYYMIAAAAVFVVVLAAFYVYRQRSEYKIVM